MHRHLHSNWSHFHSNITIYMYRSALHLCTNIYAYKWVYDNIQVPQIFLGDVNHIETSTSSYTYCNLQGQRYLLCIGDGRMMCISLVPRPFLEVKRKGPGTHLHSVTEDRRSEAM